MYYKTAAQYESSGRTGLSDVSQAGVVIELLCPLHAKAPFKPCEAAAFQSVSASNCTIFEGKSTHVSNLPVLHLFVAQLRILQRLLLTYTPAAHTRAVNPPRKSLSSLIDWFVVFETVILYEELFSCHDIF